MKKVRSEFLNVDLDVKSKADPAPLLEALGKRVNVMHVDKVGGRHWIVLSLIRQPRDPADAILGFSKLLSSLPPKARSVWSRAAKELDIGIQAGTEPDSAEWVIDRKTVEAAARLGAAIRLTIYSPAVVWRSETSRGSKDA